MKLYVWRGHGVLECHGTGLVAVLAPNLEEARAEALAEMKREQVFGLDGHFDEEYTWTEEPDPEVVGFLQHAPEIFERTACVLLEGSD